MVGPVWLRPAHIQTASAGIILSFALALIVACGGNDPAGTDNSDDAQIDGTNSDVLLDADTAGDDAENDVPVDARIDTSNDTAQADVDPGDTRDPDTRDVGAQDVRTDIDNLDADIPDAEPDAGRVFTPGTLPLPDYIGCDENSDCPNGTGNCITELTLNRALPDGTSRVPLTDVFSGLARTGVCSLSCTTSPDACAAAGFRSDPAPFTCQVVWVGDSPYPGEDGDARPPFPFDDQIQPEQMAAGRAYAALCRPPFERSRDYAPDFCATCSDTLLCLPESACIAEQPNTTGGATTGTCRIPCAGDSDCPSGFSCDDLQGGVDIVLSGVDSGSFCRPLLDTCGSCLDRDDDGRGIGTCLDGTTASAVDCDDRASGTWFDGMDSIHPFPGNCGPDLDANCNGRADDSEQIGSEAFGRFHCATCGDVCDGAFPNAASSVCESAGAGSPGVCRALCDDTTAFVDCNLDRTDGCETSVSDPNRLFIPDCDGDGVGQLNATPLFDCAGDGAFVYPIGDVTCPAVVAIANGAGGFGSDCDDDNSFISPLAAELCDGIDNDCDGVSDPSELFALGTSCTASGALGVCAETAIRVCDVAGGVTCRAGLPSQELCDNRDNNCDGFIDNFVASTPENGLGVSCTAAGAVGSCTAGSQVCTSGALTCAPGTPALTDLPRDGVDASGNPIDADCDGFDGDLDKAIFVRIGGSIGSESTIGTRANPAGTLARAFQIYYATRGVRNQFYLAGGSYTLPHMIFVPADIPGFSMIGGYSVSGTSWTAGTASTNIAFTNICQCNETLSRNAGTCTSQTCTLNQSAISVFGPRNVRLEQLSIDVPVREPGSGHVIGLRCQNSGADRCSALTLERVSISVEGGAAGTPTPAPANAGANGTSGAIPLDASLTTGGIGAASSCGARGGNGGNAISGLLETCTLDGNTFPVQPGAAGSAGSPSGRGGAGGPGGRARSGACNVSATDPTGGAGTTVTTGTGATGGGAGTSTAPLTRTSGTGGQPGVLGGGGGGGGGSGSWLFVPFAIGGTGGASGGCPGSAGNGGAPGWSAFGMWLEDDVAPVMIDFSISVGPGGAGAAGQAGGAGGIGGLSTRHPVAFGGAGGPGGHATGAGGGGGGGGGWSIGIARRPTVAVPISSTVGAGGAGGPGGLGGAGGTGPVFAVDATPTVVTAIAGQNGTPGNAGGSAQFCNLSASSIAGVPACE